MKGTDLESPVFRKCIVKEARLRVKQASIPRLILKTDVWRPTTF